MQCYHGCQHLHELAPIRIYSPLCLQHHKYKLYFLQVSFSIYFHSVRRGSCYCSTSILAHCVHWWEITLLPFKGLHWCHQQPNTVLQYCYWYVLYIKLCGLYSPDTKGHCPDCKQLYNPYSTWLPSFMYYTVWGNSCATQQLVGVA